MTARRVHWWLLPLLLLPLLLLPLLLLLLPLLGDRKRRSGPLAGLRLGRVAAPLVQFTVVAVPDSIRFHSFAGCSRVAMRT